MLDAIEYGHEGYMVVEVDLPLPIGCIGGWYKWENGFVFDQQKHDELNKAADVEDMEEALAILGVEATDEEI